MRVPQNIIKRVSEESRQILASDEINQRFEQIGVVSAYLTPTKTQELLQSDFTGWGKVVKDNQLTTE